MHTFFQSQSCCSSSSSWIGNSSERVVTSDTMVKINLELDKRKKELSVRSKTSPSQLWLNYQKMLAVARTLIMADCTGSWLLHFSAVSDCIQIFAASGHYTVISSLHISMSRRWCNSRTLRRVSQFPNCLKGRVAWI